MVLAKETIKILAKHLSLHNIYKEEIIEREVELINNRSGDTNAGIRSKNKVSRTTEDIAILLASDERLAWLKGITKAIDDFRIELLKEEPILLKIMEAKYLNKTYKVYDADVIAQITCNGYPIGENMYYAKKERMLYLLEKKLNELQIKI